tara:strand:+ start:182 stop:508 length:327 start_codon:yes stop_codon:yes gene_type:complete
LERLALLIIIPYFIVLIKLKEIKMKRLVKLPFGDKPGLPTYYACVVDNNGNQIYNSPKSDIYTEKHCVGKVEKVTMSADDFMKWANDFLNVDNEPSWESKLVNDCYNR